MEILRDTSSATYLNYAEAHDLGDGSVEAGYYPADDRHTLLGPDVAFNRKGRRLLQRIMRNLSRVCPIWRWKSNPPAIRSLNCGAKPRSIWRMALQLVWLVLPERGRRRGLARRIGRRTSDRIRRSLDGSLSGEQAFCPALTLESSSDYFPS